LITETTTTTTTKTQNAKGYAQCGLWFVRKQHVAPLLLKACRLIRRKEGLGWRHNVSTELAILWFSLPACLWRDCFTNWL